MTRNNMEEKDLWPIFLCSPEYFLPWCHPLGTFQPKLSALPSFKDPQTDSKREMVV